MQLFFSFAKYTHRNELHGLDNNEQVNIRQPKRPQGMLVVRHLWCTLQQFGYMDYIQNMRNIVVRTYRHFLRKIYFCVPIVNIYVVLSSSILVFSLHNWCICCTMCCGLCFHVTPLRFGVPKTAGIM